MSQTTVFDTAVTVAKKVYFELVVLWAAVTWWGIRNHPRRGVWRGAVVGLVSMFILLTVDLGHALAHVFSARYAGAPMDELRLTGGMPRTLYWNNNVSPDTHRIRALGGPLFNLFGLLASAASYRALPKGSLRRELTAYSVAGHGLLLMLSLVPVPMVDGGTLLKWTLVARGRTESEADKAVRRVDWAMALTAAIFGVSLLAIRRWPLGGVFLGCGALLALIAAGKIR